MNFKLLLYGTDNGKEDTLCGMDGVYSNTKSVSILRNDF